MLEARSLLRAALVCAAVMLTWAQPASAAFTVSMPSPGAPVVATGDGVGTSLFSISNFVTVNGDEAGQFSWVFNRPGDLASQHYDSGVCSTERGGSGGVTSAIRCKVRPGALTVTGSDRRETVQVSGGPGGVDVADIRTGGGDDVLAISGLGARGTIDAGADGPDGDELLIPAGSQTGWTIDLRGGTAFATGSAHSAFTFRDIERVDAEASGGNQLYGDDRANELYGGERTTFPAVLQNGNDVIDGRGGNDRLYGRSGDDVLTGGPGADYFSCGEGNDTVTDATAEDTVESDCENINQLQVDLGPGAIGDNDIFELKLKVAHGGLNKKLVSGLTYPDPIVQRNAALSGGDAPVMNLFLGPVPGLPGSVESGASSEHTLVYAIDTPGNALLQTRVTGTDADGGKHADDAFARLEATYREPTKQEFDAMVAGGFIKLLDELGKVRDNMANRLTDSINKVLESRKKTRSMAKKQTRFEQAMARNMRLRANTFGWLPDNVNATKGKPSRLDVFIAGVDAVGDEFDKAGKGLVDKTLRTPAAFWKDFVFEPREGHRAAIGLEMSRAARETKGAVGGYLGTASDFYSDPAKRQAAWKDIPILVDDTERSIHALDRNLSDKILKWDDLMSKDPIAGAKQFGTLLGKIESAVALESLENTLTGGASKGLKMYAEARLAVGLTDDAVEVTSTTRRLEQIAEGAADSTNTLGNYSPAQIDRFQEITKRVGEKHGVDLEVQARPINEFAGKVEGGIGKVEALPTKNITPEDLILGAPDKWIGQAAYYKPKLAADYKKLPKPLQDRLKLRADEKLKELKQFQGKTKDPTGKAAKVNAALKKETEFVLGKNGKVKMQLVKEIDDATGAVLIKYKSLSVNGRPVFTGKSRPIVSDVDFNAVINAKTGKALPAGIRGKIELELMNEFRKATEDGVFPFGFHGWTHSGFDMKSGDYRHVLKYMLMYLPEDEALKVAQKYAKIYGTTPESFLEGYTRGKLLVKITAEGATLGPGASPLP